MSLVLALGLSPIGQGQAYAAQKAGKQSSQQEQVLQTQAGTWADAPYEYFVNPITYTGSALYTQSGTAGAAETDIENTDLLLTNGAIELYSVVKATDGTTTTTVITAGAASETEGDEGNFGNHFSKYEYLKDGAHVDSVKDAGNYTLVLYGKDYNRNKTIEVPFTVKPVDLSKAADVKVREVAQTGEDEYDYVEFAPIPNATYTWSYTEEPGSEDSYAYDLTYKGKGQTIEFTDVLEYADIDEPASSEPDEAEEGAIAYPSAKVDLDGDGTASEWVPMTASDFAFVPSTASEVGQTNVALKGLDDPATDAIEGNFTNTWATVVGILPGEFAAIGGLTVNDAVNSTANAKNKAADTGDVLNGEGEAIASPFENAAYVKSIDLANAGKNPTVANPDPAANGKVIFGETPLAKDTDYEVTYYASAAKYAADAAGGTTENALKSFPTTIGTGYVAVISVPGGDNFVPASADPQNTVVVYYDITGSESLDEVAAKADFGSAPYVAASLPISGTGTEYAQGAGASAGKLVAPTSGKFTSESGTDVTSAVGSDWRVVCVSAWTDDMERAFLGDSEYSKKYEFSDIKYENTQDAIDYCDDNEAVANAGYVNASSWVPTSPKAATVYGFNGLPAGDYQLTVVGTGSFKGGEVSGKFTVAPATAAVGTGVGQLDIAADSAGFNEGDPVTLSTEGTENVDLAPVVKMATGADDNDDATYSKALRQGNAYEVRTGQADYYVTYKQDGETVVPAAAGTYDAEFTFGGNDFAASTITKTAALTIGTPDLRTKAATVVIDQTKTYQYTGYAVEPTLKFYKEDLAALSAQNASLWESFGEQITEVLDDATGPADVTTDAVNEADWTDADEDVEAAAITIATNNATIASPTLVTSLVKDTDYTIAYSRTGALPSESYYEGKPCGVGTYDVYVWGAGDYLSTKTSRIQAYPSLAAAAADAGASQFAIGKLDLTDDDYTVAQFSGDNGATWSEYYSTTMGGATKVEPQYRLVTAATKDKEGSEVNVIDSSLYKAEMSGNDAVGTASLTITNNGKDQTDNTTATGTGEDVRTANFYIAMGTFADANASIVLTDASGQALTSTEAGKYSAEYTSQAHDVNIHVKVNGSDIAAKEAGKDAGDYIWTVTNAKGEEIAVSNKANAADLATGILNVGVYTVTVHGASGLYAGELTATYEVTAKQIKQCDSKLKITAGDNIRYDGTQKDADIKVYYDGAEFAKADSMAKASGAQYVLSGNKGVDADTYTATIEFGGNYAGTVTKTWQVKPIDISEDVYTILADDKQLANYPTADSYLYLDANGDLQTAYNAKYCYNVDYNGKAQKPTVTVYDEDYNPVGGLDYTYQYSDNVNASKYAATPQAAVTIIASGGNYTGRVTKYFMINGLALDSDRLQVTFDEDSLSYTGKPIEPTATLKYTIADGSVIDLTKDVDYEVSYSGDRTNVGDTGTAKFTGMAPNFVSGEATFVTKDFTVQEAVKKDVEVAIPTAKAGLKYTGKAQTGVAAAEGYAVTGGSATKAGSYTATATLADGYVWADGTKGAKTVKWSIAKAKNTLTVKAV